jgi:predicted amidohydrolase YtcJ
MSADGLFLRDVELGDGRSVGVRLRGAHVAAVGPDLMPRGEPVVDGEGGALLPGLHDHHVHLLATAAVGDSVNCGPPAVLTWADLAAALARAQPRDGWIRGIGYDDGSLGPLDRMALDFARADTPVRVQHRSGALWIVNSAGADALQLDAATVAGIERDGGGRPTGRLWRLDGWLRSRLGAAPMPDLAALSRRLANYGITGVTDATPDLEREVVDRLRGGAIAQRLLLLGEPDGRAPVKIVIADHALPGLDHLATRIERARPRPVALHCVTRVALVLALSVLAEVGAVPGDRVEHAAVCPPELARRLAALGIAVVTQPSLIVRRGDEYLDRVEPDDVDALWPFASLLRAGVAVGCSSDAPYGDADPWATIAAARTRMAPSGRRVAPSERVSARVALNGFLSPPKRPGGSTRRVCPRAAADLVLLDRPLADALRQPSAEHVRMTLMGGMVAFAADAAACC